MLRNSLDTSLLDVELAGEALDLGVNRIAIFEALAGHGAIAGVVEELIAILLRGIVHLGSFFQVLM